MKNLLDRIIPPDDPKKVTNWRWVMVIALGLVVLNGMSGRGLTYGVGAYASEASVQSLSDKMDRSFVLQLAATLRDLRKEECRANGNKQLLQQHIEEAQQDYIEITNKRYPLTPCKELV